MKKLFLLSAFALTFAISAKAQYGRGCNSQGNDYRQGSSGQYYGNSNVNSNATGTVMAPVAYQTQAPVGTYAATPVYNALQGNQYNEALSSIASQSLDDGKLAVANQIANYNYLYAWQVREIMLQFNFDETKLQFARMAFRNTIDKQNFYTVNDAFSFPSNAQVLSSYLY